MLQRATFLLNGDLSPQFGGDGAVAQEGQPQQHAETGTQVVHQDAQQGAQDQGFFSWQIIAVWVAVIGIFYFMTIRPQRKRAKEMKEMQTGLRVGDKVVTNSGMFGRIAEVGHDSFVVEFGTNRSIHIPVRKTDVQGVLEPKMTAPPSDKA